MRGPLYLAAANENEEAVGLLLADWFNKRDSKLKGGLRVNPNLASGSFRCRALIWAALYGNGAIAKLLLAFPNIDPNFKGGVGRTPLAFAAESGHVEVVRLLLAHPNIDLNVKDDQGHTALSQAQERGRDEVVELLIEAGAE
jgi:ankyrin repeat protein